jgi:hypothetical protein
MVRSGSGNIKFLYHFKFDVESPLRLGASNQLWGIMGHAPGQGVPVALPQDPWVITNGLEVPSFATLAQARSVADLKAVPSAHHADKAASIKLDYVNAMAVPPFLAAKLMEADTEEPGVLCMVACKGVRDFDTALCDPAVRAEHDCTTGPAEDAFTDIAKFLWATAVLIDSLTPGPALPWYQACQERYLVPPGPPDSSSCRVELLGEGYSDFAHRIGGQPYHTFHSGGRGLAGKATEERIRCS